MQSMRDRRCVSKRQGETETVENEEETRNSEGRTAEMCKGRVRSDPDPLARLLQARLPSLYPERRYQRSHKVVSER